MIGQRSGGQTQVRQAKRGTFRMEQVEPRCLRSVSFWSGTSISDLFGDYFGSVLFGDNGDPWGYATGTAGVGSQESTWLYVEWDDYLYDGADSGLVFVQLSINADGDGLGNIAAGNSEADAFYVGSPSVESVTMRAGVMAADMQMSWSGVSVAFCRDGSIIETVNVGDFGVSTMNGPNTPAESGVVVTPSGSNFDGVMVTGYARLQAAEGTYPGASDIFGQIFVS